MSLLLNGDHLSYFIEGGTTEAISSKEGITSSLVPRFS